MRLTTLLMFAVLMFAAMAAEKELDNCEICFEPMTKFQKVISRNTVCKHYFHRKCLDSWVNTSTYGDCPKCRQVLRKGPRKTQPQPQQAIYRPPPPPPSIVDAARQNNLQRVRDFINMGTYVDQRNDFGMTALEFACFNRNMPIIQLLLNNQADPNLASLLGEKPLLSHYAEHEDIEIMNELIAHGANVSQQDVQGLTPLMYAVTGNKLDAVEVLLQQNANVNIQTHLPKETVLMQAVTLGYRDIVKRLLKVPSLNLKLRNSENKTAQHLAKERGDMRGIVIRMRSRAFKDRLRSMWASVKAKFKRKN